MDRLEVLDGRLQALIKAGTSGSDTERRLREERLRVWQEAKFMLESAII